MGKGTFATAFPGAGGAAGVEGGTDAVDDAGTGTGAGTGAGAGAGEGAGAVDAVSSLGALPSEYAAAIAASADPSATSSPIDPGSIIFNG